jgi:hypothetical protein
MTSTPKFVHKVPAATPLVVAAAPSPAPAGAGGGRGAPQRYFLEPAQNIKCFNCGEVGHMSWQCMNEKVRGVQRGARECVRARACVMGMRVCGHVCTNLYACVCVSVFVSGALLCVLFGARKN